ncbi:MAG: hypothetical protein WCT46_02795 [Candidatus Gracilibacteria bacterium]|jgi:hypothetical protein
MKKVIIVFGLLILFAGCTQTISQEGKYDCVVDTDCKNSCSQGAVNGTWYSENMDYSQECLDGCDGPGSDTPQCIENQCVAFTQGVRDAGCTNQ